ncbi:copper resistance protein CopC [Planococcus sp. N028]|uniref:Copper resistance protein CopC n=1 Tax=Planococcus shixiaomingii TaxID=3058393 RepID=A0ABT8N1X6_9BACL|nr:MULTISPECIES: copper resistance CopC family protein [unclassified Planococcus (in: firmicutes)]MDN7241885.1 copper resistance protein CopC [Planococcus sp. N028]WKA54170.1 copper resistance protein CopC [Planococcus sp. N022]
MKKIILAVVLLILALPITAQAHTTLTTSTPAEGEVMKEALKDVQLTFGTVIEQGSTMTLQGEETEFEFENITVSENVLTGTLNEELPNGAYTVEWKIIGADSHPIEGEIPFAIDVETVEEPVVENEGTASEEPAVEEEGTADEEPVAGEQTKASEAAAVEEKNNLIVTALMIAAALLLVIGMFRLFKKKQ